MRSVCCFALLVCVAAASLSVASAEGNLTIQACPNSAAVNTYNVHSVAPVNFTTVVPGEAFSILLDGQLASAITGGVFSTQLYRDAGRTMLGDDFGPLDQLRVGPWPAAGPSSQLQLQWTLPKDTPLTHDDKNIILRFEALDQNDAQVTCLLITLPVTAAAPQPDDKPSDGKAIGYVCAFISVFFFGTNYLPVKAYDTGDGVFFQWVLCVGVWLVGMVVQLVRGAAFEPLAMVGGMMWCLGNTLTVPIIQMIGLGVGMCIWGTACLVMGWASGRFGFLGVNQQAVANQAMNICGLLLCVASMGLMFQVKSVKQEQEEAAASGALDEGLLSGGHDDGTLQRTSSQQREFALRKRNASVGSPDSELGMTEQESQSSSWVDKLSPGQKRVCGITLSLVAGSLYGLNFNPPQYLIDSGKGASSHGIDYVFSHFCGIFVTSTVYTAIYCVIKKNRPQVNHQVLLPALFSGIGWAIAQTSWFVANDRLHFVGTFPIISTGPGIVATLCAIIFYQEIQGRKNYLFLAAAAAVIGAGVALIANSLPKGA